MKNFFRKVPGFRSSVGWKMALAGSAYLLAGSTLVAGVVTSPPPANTQPSSAQQEKKPVVTTETVKTTETIPCDHQKVDDPNLPQGQQATRQACANGTKEITWQVTKKDGAETARAKQGEAVTAVMVPEIIAKGAKPVPAPSSGDGYTNVDGNHVQSPMHSPSGPPAGATAQCADGTYSFSQHRSGTCSYHGGVARWL